MLPSLFVSHGAPTLPLTDAHARVFLEGLAERLSERPRAILVISAHWETAVPSLTAGEVNATIHDFHAFRVNCTRSITPQRAASGWWTGSRR
jgi:4,5-DOPA dioxygenase extradiol